MLLFQRLGFIIDVKGLSRMSAAWLSSGRLLVNGFLLLCGIFVLMEPVVSIKWLALSKEPAASWNTTKSCLRARRAGGFVKAQTKICRDNLQLMDVIAGATDQAVRVCQRIFSDRRWNCSSIMESPDYLADLTGGSREQAFAYALASATLTQSVSRACSMGVSAKCTCGRLPTSTPEGDFKWGGCGDNIQFGLQFSRAFTDASVSTPKQKAKTTKRSTMNLHNYEAGRQIAVDSMKTQCKCHGVSASCSIKTCWKGLGTVEEIGRGLMKKYAVAIEVENRRINRRRSLAPIRIGNGKKKNTVGSKDLIYFTKSPDYCMPDTSSGSLGTHGRTCDPETTGSGGCRSMCCGRGFSTEVVQQETRCECKYYWCCYVRCKTCIRRVTVHRCR